MSRTIKRVFKQKPHATSEHIKETFQTNSNEPGKILALVCVTIPGTSDCFFQNDHIPEMHGAADTDDGDEAGADDKGKPKVYFSPDPDDVVVPSKASGKNMPWISNDLWKRTWIRADGASWNCKVLVRKFRSDTDEYIEACVINLEWLQDIDPNDEQWVERYNAYFRQLAGS